VDRRNQIPLTSQLPGETTSELPLVHQYQDWTLKEKLQNFYRKIEISVVPEAGVFLWSLNVVFFFIVFL
jgi:hypothetical protein